MIDTGLTLDWQICRVLALDWRSCNGSGAWSVLHIVPVLAMDWQISPGLTFDWQISLGLTHWSRIRKEWRWSGISLEMDQAGVGAGLAL